MRIGTGRDGRPLDSLLDRFSSTVRVGWSALVLRSAKRLHHQSLIALTYPPTADPSPRFGHGKPWHPELAALLDEALPTAADELQSFFPYKEALEAVPAESQDLLRWRQHWLPALDALALYAYMQMRKPASYIEVGSGTSTSFVAHAKSSAGLHTEVISIDPEPRGEVDGLCDHVIRSPFELCFEDVLDIVREGDLLFFDGSHQVFTNSDAVTFFLELLPRLPPGVLVGIHDVFLPASYPPQWREMYYAEQYLLGAMLLGGGNGLRVRLPAYYATVHPSLAETVGVLTASARRKGAAAGGQAFWFETTPRRDESLPVQMRPRPKGNPRE